jgi:Protein of unknown function (DUF2911)
VYALISLVLALIAPSAVPQRQQQPDGAAFVTTLGRDTIALESYRRTAARLDGDILLRVPRTVRYHYAFTFRPDGGISRSVVDLTPLSAGGAPAIRTSIAFVGDSARVDIDSAGAQQTITRAIRHGTVPELMSGFGSDYGLYISLGMYESLFTHLTAPVNDTTTFPVIGAVGGQPGSKLIVRRSPTLIDVDYFKILWTHVAVNANGRVEGADATETTERTRSTRTAPINIDSAAKEFIRRDRAGKAFGISSPADSVRARLGTAAITIDYSSPRKRGRDILGTTVLYDRVWRTGANAATVLTVNQLMTIGGYSLPAGVYTLWTLPTKGGVQLVINGQHGQWGTDYDPTKDVVRLPMKEVRGQPVQENFTITLAATGNAGELRMQWDDFVWSIPMSVR